MKKIPSVFKRVFEEKPKNGVREVLDEFTNDECREAFLFGAPTIKFDGAACAIINGELWKRYDAKRGKTPPEGAIECSPPDPVTGHYPHWVKCDSGNPADKWFIGAFTYYMCVHPVKNIKLATYEAVGEHFNGNPYGLNYDTLVPHGCNEVYLADRSLEGVRKWLEENEEEGLVFWLNGEPVCKIKRSDFGIPWGHKSNLR